MTTRVEIPAGDTLIGSDDDYPEERPAYHRRVEAFAMDIGPVTVADFAAFVEETDYLTTAERPPDPARHPDADPDLLVPGSLVFVPTAAAVPLDDVRQWWAYVPGTSWRCPGGPGTTAEPDHPVVHVSYLDATAYAAWARGLLPSEEQWEHAARAGGTSHYAWGGVREPGGVRLANTWHGHFPWDDSDPDGFPRTSPVGSYPANPWGLYDMIGNVWEWTSSAATPSHGHPAGRDGSTTKVIKGGSFLCSPEFSRRYRPAARQFEGIESSTSHLGFRCIEPS